MNTQKLRPEEFESISCKFCFGSGYYYIKAGKRATCPRCSGKGTVLVTTKNQPLNFKEMGCTKQYHKVPLSHRLIAWFVVLIWLMVIFWVASTKSLINHGFRCINSTCKTY